MKPNKNYIIAGASLIAAILLILMMFSEVFFLLPRQICVILLGIFPLIILTLLVIALIALMKGRPKSTSEKIISSAVIIVLLVIIAGIFVPVMIFEAFFHNTEPGSIEYPEGNYSGASPEKDDAKEEPTPAFHGYHVTIANISESTSWVYPRNSTLEDLAGRGYDIISITPEDVEKYSYLKEGLKPGASDGEYKRALKNEEKDDFFEKFYGKCFSYGGHNYVINLYKN